ncbi:MAG TPA: hypothetical protein VM534_03245, partial [Thermoanaerobaculia bacterium]|nr:hypothetical protein [Thermoanaerobaculia bacterium]
MFETAVIASGHSGRRTAVLVLPVSVTLHAAVIALAIVVTTWSVRFPADSPHQIGSFVIGTMVELPGGGGAPDRSRPEPEPPRQSPPPESSHPAVVPLDQSRETMTPAEIPSTLPDLPAAGEQTGADSQGIDGGVGGGDRGGSGIGPGAGSGSGPGGPGSGTPLNPRHVGGDVKEPLVVHRVDPDYPRAARMMGLQGIVILQCII